MMKNQIKNLTVALMVLFANPGAAIYAQFVKGNGNVTKSERKIASFQYIQVEDGIDLYLTQGTDNELAIEADENLHQYIETKIEDNDVLKIQLTKNIYKAKSLKVYLKFKDIKGLQASGGSDVETDGILKLNNLSAICSGGSDMRLEIDANELKFKASGGSDGYLKGKVNIFSAIASGGSDIKAFSLETEECNIEVTGGSDAEVYTTNTLKARGFGGSDIAVKGNPQNVDSNMSGGSDLIRQ